MHRDEKRVFIAIPAHEYTIDVRLGAELVYAMMDLWRIGWTMSVHYVLGDPFIGRARDQLFASFLRHSEQPCKLLFIDDDVVPERGAIARIIQHPDEIIGGLYPARTEPEAYKFNMRPGENRLDQRGFLRIEDLPTGFMCVARSAAEKIKNANLDREYDEGSPPRKQWAVFNSGFIRVQLPDGSITGGFRGEDFDFCRRARLLDIPIMADPWLKFQHVGKKSYAGCFGTWKLREIIRDEQRKELELVSEERRDELELLDPPCPATPECGGDSRVADRPVEALAGAGILEQRKRELNGGTRPVV